jgi:hypothetical protein
MAVMTSRQQKEIMAAWTVMPADVSDVMSEAAGMIEGFAYLRRNCIIFA